MRELSFVEAIREAQDQLLERYEDVFIIGEGVTDPKSVFGTCKNLAEKYPSRVFDSPVSESGVTGVCIGAAVEGLRPIHVHQRMDFSLYAMDQIVNNLAKWKSMFGLDRNLSMVIRMTVGRGWGAGNQHAQNLEALFAHIPGLQVIVPHSPSTAKGLLIAAVESKKPTIFIEHKWLHNMKEHVSTEYYSTDIQDCTVHDGFIAHTLISWGATSLVAKQAASLTGSKLILLHSLNAETVLKYSIHNDITIASDDWWSGGFASELISEISLSTSKHLKFRKWGNHDEYVPSSHVKAKDYYVAVNELIESIDEITGFSSRRITSNIPHDVDPNLGKVISAI